MKKDMFKHGPLYNRRFEIVENLKKIGLRSGDILYRYSDAKGPLNIPFCKIVTRLTQSEYSHSAIVLMECGEINVLEINDEGTIKYRLLDWIDTCYKGHFSIYRLKNINYKQEAVLAQEINEFLSKDPDYDFTFSDPDKFYCTETIIYIYQQALGITLDEGYLLKDIVNKFQYFILKFGSMLFSVFGTTLPFDEKIFFVGNESKGMMSSLFTELIVKI